jgi:hypothetical protein
MQTATHHSAEARESAVCAVFVSLDRETRAGVETECAAYHLNRRPQTLRCWAAFETGPLRPRRINGRLMWPWHVARAVQAALDDLAL